MEEGDDQNALRNPAHFIAAAGQYSYAITRDGVFSWGMGENYVLGNRDDCNEFFPYKLDPRMFEEHVAVQIGCGTQHTVALVLESNEAQIPELNDAAFTSETVPAKTETKEIEEDQIEEEKPIKEEVEAVPVEITENLEPVELKTRSIEEVAGGEEEIIESQNSMKRLKIEDIQQ